MHPRRFGDIVNDVFGVGSVQLYADSAVKLLQCIVPAAGRLLIGLLLAARVPSLFSLNADRISVVHHCLPRLPDHAS